MSGGPFEKSDALIVGQRDARLLRKINELAENRLIDVRIVGVLYGAHHMRAVAQFLLQLGSRVAEAEWITVFEY